MTRFDRMKMEAIAKGKAEGMAEGMAEVARNLLIAGVAKEIIAQATGLSMADIEVQSNVYTP